MTDDELGREIRALLERSGRQDVQVITSFERDVSLFAKSFGASLATGQWRWEKNTDEHDHEFEVTHRGDGSKEPVTFEHVIRHATSQLESEQIAKKLVTDGFTVEIRERSNNLWLIEGTKPKQ